MTVGLQIVLVAWGAACLGLFLVVAFLGVKGAFRGFLLRRKRRRGI